MRNILRKAYFLLGAIRCAPIILVTLLSSKVDIIFSDQDRWATIMGRTVPKKLGAHLNLFVELMTFVPEYRTILYYRLGLIGKFLSIICPRIPGFDISAESIGPGFCVRHGFGALVSADLIGENCIIHQHVTVGYRPSDDTRPTLGNNVTIFPGATIIGKIHIGDNSTIGANTLVLGDVPPNVTVVGVPGKIVLSNRPGGCLAS